MHENALFFIVNSSNFFDFFFNLQLGTAARNCEARGVVIDSCSHHTPSLVRRSSPMKIHNL